MAETPYLETEALLAVLNEDQDEAQRLLLDYGSVSTAKELQSACITLMGICGSVMRELREKRESQSRNST